MRRAVPAPVTVITTYSDTPIDVALLYPFMAQVEKACQERRMAKIRPAKSRTERKSAARIQETL